MYKSTLMNVLKVLVKKPINKNCVENSSQTFINLIVINIIFPIKKLSRKFKSKPYQLIVINIVFQYKFIAFDCLTNTKDIFSTFFNSKKINTSSTFFDYLYI